jgi:hypothetical protein
MPAVCVTAASACRRHQEPGRYGLGCEGLDGRLVESDGLSGAGGHQERRRHCNGDEQAIF